MRRRDFITVLAGATAWIFRARAQEHQHVIGFLSSAQRAALNSSDSIGSGANLGKEHGRVARTFILERMPHLTSENIAPELWPRGLCRRRDCRLVDKGEIVIRGKVDAGAHEIIGL
jgi:hypothetical protein